MIAAGYMVKFIDGAFIWHNGVKLDELYCVGSHSVPDFADWLPYDKHNGYYFFNSYREIMSLAKDLSIDPSRGKLFFYQVYEMEFDIHTKSWASFSAEAKYKTLVEKPENTTIQGYDIVAYSCGTTAECSILFCNGLADTIGINKHLLFHSFKGAKEFLEACNPLEILDGPHRIIEVHSVEGF